MDDNDLRGVVIGTIAMLREHTQALNNARQMLYDANRLAEDTAEKHHRHEQLLRANLLLDGLTGKNQAERDAQLLFALNEDRHLSDLRENAQQARRGLAEVQMLYDRAYRTQQTERAILAALTALVGGAE